MTKRETLIIRNLKKVYDYLKKIDVSDIEFQEEFKVRIGRCADYEPIYVGNNRYFFVADFAKKSFYMLNTDS